MILPALYAIADADAARACGWTLPKLAEACFAAGVRLLQVRAKGLASGELLEVCERVVEAAASWKATVIVNDRADVASLLPPAGVHVGQEDLPPAAARRLVGADVPVGFSTHSPEQVDRAIEEPIDYLAVGPVFGTRTKDTGYAAVGLDLVRYAVGAAAVAARRRGTAPIPVVAIGGITLTTAPSILDAGAASVAVISDLLVTGDPAARVREYLALPSR